MNHLTTYPVYILMCLWNSFNSFHGEVKYHLRGTVIAWLVMIGVGSWQSLLLGTGHDHQIIQLILRIDTPINAQKKKV